MSSSSSIEWTESTWSPVTGCEAVSSGCANCYSARLTATRLRQQPKYKGLAVLRDGQARFTGEVRLHEDALSEPLHWRKPRRIFVCSMSDLFHKDVPFEFIDKVFAIMALCPQHTFQVLTKRPERMAEYFRENDGLTTPVRIEEQSQRLQGKRDGDAWATGFMKWPLPAVWLGTSVEDQPAADARIPHLLKCPAAVRFLSCEPLIGPVDYMAAIYPPPKPEHQAIFDRIHAGENIPMSEWPPINITGGMDSREYVERGRDGKPIIDWVIIGGESGPGARPCNIEWIRSIVKQCREAGTKCFVKQLGKQPFEEIDGGPVGVNDFPIYLNDPKGGDMSEWPEDLRVRELPT